MSELTVFLNGIEIKHFGFFDGFNWELFGEGDRVFVEDCDTAIISDVEYVTFDYTDGVGVYLLSPAGVPIAPSDSAEDYLPSVRMENVRL